MATLVLDTLWSEYNLEQLQTRDSPFYGSADIALESVLHEVFSRPRAAWLSHLSEEHWVIGKQRFLNSVISHCRTAPEPALAAEVLSPGAGWEALSISSTQRAPLPGLCASRQCAQCCSHMALARENTMSIRDSTTSQTSARGWGQSINCRLALGLKRTQLHFWSIQEANPWHHAHRALPWWFCHWNWFASCPPVPYATNSVVGIVFLS